MTEQTSETNIGTSQTSVRPVHGGVRPGDLRALGLKPEDVLDFSASVSPIGPPSGLWQAIMEVDLSAYPDPECLELREALSSHLSPVGVDARAVPIDRIWVGNGSTELIHLLTRSFLSPPRRGGPNTVLQFTPTYGEYSGASRLAGAQVLDLTASGSPPFGWNLQDAARLIDQERPSLVFLCNPNNPTGVYLGDEDVQFLAKAVTATGGLLVLDEAYLSFVADSWNSLRLVDGGNVALLRSMTKDYALTALRLGYMVASEEVIETIAALQPDWSVNGLAQAAGLVVLSDPDYLDRARAEVDKGKSLLRDRLGRLGLTVHPSHANYLLIDVGDAAQWRDRLMRRGLFVRDCASFGLPSCIRVGIRALSDCQRLANAITELAGN